MKKLLFAFLAIFLMLNSSCSRDDDSSDFTSDSVVGSWYMNSVKVKGKLTYMGQSANVDKDQPTDACTKKTTFTFNSNGTGTAVNSMYVDNVCTTSPAENFTYTYDSSTKKLVVTQDGVSETMVLTSLKPTEFSFGETFNNVNFGEYDPTLEGYYYTGTISTVFKKQ